MHEPLLQNALDQLFLNARTYHAWKDQPVSDELLQNVYDLAKWGPTSANCLPMRLMFIKSKEEKERLVPALSGGNVAQVRQAPVTTIVAFDEKFYELMPKLWPRSDMKKTFESDPALAEATRMRNGSLQGAYLILAARSLGLDCGPMSGFKNSKVDEIFFAGTTWKSNFLCNLGYGDPTKLYPRGPRLSFAEACRIV